VVLNGPTIAWFSQRAAHQIVFERPKHVWFWIGATSYSCLTGNIKRMVLYMPNVVWFSNGLKVVRFLHGLNIVRFWKRWRSHGFSTGQTSYGFSTAWKPVGFERAQHRIFVWLWIGHRSHGFSTAQTCYGFWTGHKSYGCERAKHQIVLQRATNHEHVLLFVVFMPVFNISWTLWFLRNSKREMSTLGR